jgi:hypothetical protein
MFIYIFFKGGIFGVYDIQHCFICRPSDSTVSEDAAIEPRTVATTALAVRRSNHSARSQPRTECKCTYLCYAAAIVNCNPIFFT